ncbi:MAG: cell division protein FtsW [Planctomycetes bacterium]|nr:cell division protein FtsW [Planctomycetota bacterium]
MPKDSYMRSESIQIKLDRVIELAVLLLMATGTVFVFSAGATVSGEYDLVRFYNITILKQLVFFPLAVVVMYAVSAVDYRRFSFTHRPAGYSWTPYLFGVTVLLLVFVLFAGVERNQSRRWMDLMPGPVYVSFQPSEMAKWVMILFVAGFLDKYASTLDRFKQRFAPICMVIALVVVLIIKEDFGTAAFIALISYLLLFVGGARIIHLLSPLPLMILGFAGAVMMSPTRVNRIKDFLDSSTMGYQAKQSLIAISTGGIFGKGLGQGVIKYGHLPEDTTDFIFSIIAEEMGLVACLFVMLLFVLFAWAGIAAVLRCKNRFGRLAGIGIVMAVTLQAIINIGVVTVVLPTKGIPLPFISAGGTSMLLTSAAVGILLNIARHGQDADQAAARDIYHKNSAIEEVGDAG